jgi:transposase
VVVGRPRKYPDELRERAVQMVFALREASGRRAGAIWVVANELDIHPEALRQWVRKAEIGTDPSPPT